MNEDSGIQALVHSVTDTWKKVVDRPGIILISTFLGILVWGPLGRPLFSPWFQSWILADPATAGFRRELFSYATGFLLLVLIPILLIRFRFKEPLANYGLGLGDVRIGVLFTLVFMALTIIPFYLTAKNPTMWAEYPMLYKGMSDAQIKAQFTWSYFAQYELFYGIFFFVIEFIFRGYLLFGLKPELGSYTVLLQTLPYITWHLAKPVSELLPTPLWGFVVGAVTLRVRSVWYIFIAHWLLNIFLDTTILHLRGVF